MTTGDDDKMTSSDSPGISPETIIAETAGEDGAGLLQSLAALGEELGTDRVANEARELAARTSEGRFYVACVGQVKRGKSTLINALIGESVLPVGFVPVTAIPTVIRYGEQFKARLKDRDYLWREIPISDLKQYVSEEHNPENVKCVTGVEVFVPTHLLSTGMCLVDTPGLGSVFAGNTSATQDFIPHIDAALVVVGADPPLAGDELKTVEDVACNVDDLIIVINKADRTSDEERAVASDFTRKLLERRLNRPIGRIFQVSAAERLENRGPVRDWDRFVDVLERLVQDSGRQIILAACGRGIERLSEELLAIVAEEREALKRPIEESERRIVAMKATVAYAGRSMRELGFLLMAEQQRLSDLFMDRRKAFLRSTLPIAFREFHDVLPSVAGRFGPSYRRVLMSRAQEIAKKYVMPWLASEQQEGEREYREATQRFVQMGTDFLQKLAEAGIPELTRMPHALDIETGFRIGSRFSFLDLIEVAQPASPLRWLADLLLGLTGARTLIQRDAAEFLEHLLETNSARIQSDVLNRVQESRGRLEIEVKKLLHEVSRIAEHALAHARSTRDAGAAGVESALLHLDRIERLIRKIQTAHLT